MATFTDLPNDVIEAIISRLGNKEQGSLACTSKLYNDLVHGYQNEIKDRVRQMILANTDEYDFVSSSHVIDILERNQVEVSENTDFDRMTGDHIYSMEVNFVHPFYGLVRMKKTHRIESVQKQRQKRHKAINQPTPCAFDKVNQFVDAMVFV